MRGNFGIKSARAHAHDFSLNLIAQFKSISKAIFFSYKDQKIIKLKKKKTIKIKKKNHFFCKYVSLFGLMGAFYHPKLRVYSFAT